jgi:hypothetical protein
MSRLSALLAQAEFLVAHNAAFDRAFLSRLLPESGQMPWLCSMRGVDWLASGCPGRSLDILRNYFGLGGAHHRAGADTAATFQLLTMTDDGGRPYLGQLLDRLPDARSKAAVLQHSKRPDQCRVERRYFRPTFTSRSMAVGPVRFDVSSGRLEIRIEQHLPIARDPRPQLQELKELLAGIVADGAIDAEGFRTLDQWLLYNVDLADEHPFNLLISQLGEILLSGTATVHGLAKLHEIALQILHPQSLGCIDVSCVEATPMTQPPPVVEFTGKLFVFTGNFYFGEKAICERATMERGGLCKGNVTRATHYVVVGGKGSPEWLYGCFGSKIEKAIANVRSGFPTAVISEAHWAHALDRVPIGEATSALSAEVMPNQSEPQ